jgi:mono/diheme cytochrome c family protein
MREPKLFKFFSMPFLLILVAGAIALHGSKALAAETDDALQGRIYYLRYCAACHGDKADGKGPVSGVLSSPPADLRRLSEKYGNPLPSDPVIRFIDGREAVAAHGSREMPVWGERFYESGGGKVQERQVRGVLSYIVAYLRTIQITRTSG